MAPSKLQVKAKRNLTCSSCNSWIDFAKSGCANSWAEVQADDFTFVCSGCMTVKYLQEQVNELRHMILMMTGQGKKEESRGGENDESRGGETEESRGGENEESRGGDNEENRGGENKESNVREKAGKKKKDGQRKNVQQKEDKRVSEEGLSGGRIVEDNKSREKEKTVDQKKKDDRNNAEKEGTSAIVGKYRRLIKTLKEARVGQIVLSGI